MGLSKAASKAPKPRMKAVATKAMKAMKAKGILPCSGKCIMVPTGKKAKDPGVNNRMKRAKGKKVEEVVGKMKYDSPKGQLCYNVSDLRYDLKRSYLKVKVARKAMPSQAKQGSAKGEFPCSPKAVMCPTGKKAKCRGVNNRMLKCKDKTVESPGFA